MYFIDNLTDRGVILTDLDGDGFADILVGYSNATAGMNNGTWLRNASTPHLLKSITHEFGGVTAVEYDRSTRFNPSGNDSLSDLGFNIWVVANVTRNGGLSRENEQAPDGRSRQTYNNSRQNPHGMARGRPPKSEIRQNLVEVLHVLKRAYGYELYKAYLEAFPKVSMRVVYYHLRKGCQFGLFRVERVLVEPGEYSWGPDAEKVYYALGGKAIPQKQRRVRDALRGFLSERKWKAAGRGAQH